MKICCNSVCAIEHCTALSSLLTPASSSSHVQQAIRVFIPGSKLPGLKAAGLTLLRQKQSKLAKNASSTLSLYTEKSIRNALNATLIFAQYEAGTAVCIDPSRWILTYAHCFGDDEEEYKTAEKRRWLLFYTGLAVQVECRQWDPTRDLALLKILAIESNAGKEGDIPTFSSVPLSPCAPTCGASIVCIGQLGKDDLESTFSRRTKYNMVGISEGLFRGMIRGANPHDNSGIGTLKHTAWTYWGHSGAPLLLKDDGTLIELHSSWDDQTIMRHGVPLIAIKHFTQQPQKLSAAQMILTKADS